MKLNKLKVSIENSLWQTIPMLSTLLLSLLVVKFYSTAVWGSIVSVLVVQQLISGVLVWGNKDYLQRELTLNPNGFKSIFTQLFFERALLFFLIIPIIFFSQIINTAYFLSLLLLVFWRFVIQSFDVLIIIRRKFLLLTLVDFTLLFTQVIWLFSLKNEITVSLNNLLIIFWLPLVAKSFFLIIFFRHNFEKFSFKKLLLSSSFFFGMISVSALIHGKIDVFLVSKLLNIEVLGKYQIIMSFLWCIQSVSMFISGPFVHNFYRLKPDAQINSSRLLKNIGFIIVPVAVTIVMAILYFIFSIKINLSIILASLLFSITSFIYLPWIFQINQKKAEHLILGINILGSFILIGLFLLANNLFGLTLEITIWIVAIHQILITFLVFMANKKPSYAK